MIEPHKKSLQVLVTCEQCFLLFRTLDKHVGAQAPCPSCGQMLRITAGTRIRAPAPPAQSAVPLPPMNAVTPAVDAGTSSRDLAADIPAPPLNYAASTDLPVPIPPPPLIVPPVSASPAMVAAPPVIFPVASASPGDASSTGGCLLSGLAALALFSGGMLLLVAAIVAVVPPPNDDWAQQKWSGAVCSLLAATAFALPGAWLWRRGSAMRSAKRELEGQGETR